MARQLKTSWESSSKWYDKIVGKEGHYYHQNVILPKLLPLMALKQKQLKILDLGCGQGILSRVLPDSVEYVGVDLSKTLISSAIALSKNPSHRFILCDVTTKLPLPKKTFSHATAILSLQNIEKPRKLLQNAFDHLQEDGRLFLVLNHPCFRIPRQSSWGIDEKKKCQYRRIDAYLAPQKIPIQTHPGKKEGQTFSFHFSLADYSAMLQEAGFSIALIEEWVSNKKSTGPKAKMENRARSEFPLFLCLVLCKQNSS